MPIYAYKCDSCGFAKDILRKISDPLLTQCPECGKDTFSKQVTAAGFQLKGSGWYATDFKGSGAGAAEAAPAGADAAPSSTPIPTSTADVPSAKPVATPAVAGGGVSPA